MLSRDEQNEVIYGGDTRSTLPEVIAKEKRSPTLKTGAEPENAGKAWRRERHLLKGGLLCLLFVPIPGTELQNPLEFSEFEVCLCSANEVTL